MHNPEAPVSAGTFVCLPSPFSQVRPVLLKIVLFWLFSVYFSSNLTVEALRLLWTVQKYAKRAKLNKTDKKKNRAIEEKQQKTREALGFFNITGSEKEPTCYFFAQSWIAFKFAPSQTWTDLSHFEVFGLSLELVRADHWSKHCTRNSRPTPPSKRVGKKAPPKALPGFFCGLLGLVQNKLWIQLWTGPIDFRTSKTPGSAINNASLNFEP